MKFQYLPVMLAAALTGCTTADQMSTAESKAFLEVTDAKCKALGYQPKTSKYAQCVQTFQTLKTAGE